MKLFKAKLLIAGLISFVGCSNTKFSSDQASVTTQTVAGYAIPRLVTLYPRAYSFPQLRALIADAGDWVQFEFKNIPAGIVMPSIVKLEAFSYIKTFVIFATSSVVPGDYAVDTTITDSDGGLDHSVLKLRVKSW